MEDMAPALIEKIQKDFERRMKAEPEIAKLLQGIVDGSRSYTDALNLGDELGAALSDAVAAGLTGGVLPDDTLYYNIAKRLIDQVGGGAFDVAQDAAVQVQENINREAGLGLAAIAPDTKAGRLDDLVNTVAGKPLAECLPDIKSAMRALPQGAASNTMQANMEFQSKAGLRARIVRTYHKGKHDCEYCARLAGSYEYPLDNTDVYRRHQNCRCKLEYITGKKSKTLWSSGDKAQQRAQEKAKEARLEKYNALDAKAKKKEDARRAARKRFAENESQAYRAVQRGEAAIFSSEKYVDVMARKIETYSTPVYVSDKAVIKPRALHDINKNTEDALRAYGVPIDRKSTIIIVAESELPNAWGRYDAVKNEVYYIPEIADKKLQKELKNTEYHEMWHLKQAEDFRNAGWEITNENYQNYLNVLRKRSKLTIDKIGINEYNVGAISSYAKKSYYVGFFDEVEAEYRAQKEIVR